MSTSTEQLRVRVERLEKVQLQQTKVMGYFQKRMDDHDAWHHSQACAFPKRRWWQFWK